uniref:Uncharacterized protein n=1 Tax=Pseudictyota dubia TaxID=2749911 RepID=A0A6U2CFY6_9STRA|mmetsp:Transcript_24858/g.45971  ORF Transcript_24858/g.45971 Transcript_24858/m.45971 type:complete len:109 (+) Transcript_24858:337-663(+)
MGLPYVILGAILLLIPVFIRDFGYKLFAKHRGAIWKRVKGVTGIGDTYLIEYRNKMVGLDEEQLDPGWGFAVNDNEDDEGSVSGIEREDGDLEDEAKPFVGPSADDPC